jgi:nitrogen fixation/metabolism regulation signal transduction histidine kinase
MEKWLESFAGSGFRRAADVAHDLKTPLNVAVLNLELLRMRLAKVSDDDPDEKIAGYLRSVEMELRRMARIFDAFFVHAAPPRGDQAPEMLDAVAPIRQELLKAGMSSASAVSGRAPLLTHPQRWTEAARLLAEAVPKIFEEATVVFEEESSEQTYKLSIAGRSRVSESDLGKLFKFYYTDPSGNPDLSLATARLIVETYGGSLDIHEKDDRAVLELILAVGDR